MVFLDKPKNAWLQTQDFAQSIHNWRALVSPSFGVGSPASVGSPGLFNSTRCSPFSNSSGSSPSIPTGTKRGSEVHQKLHNKFQNTPQSSNFNHDKINPGSSVRSTVVGKNLMLSFSPNTYNNRPKLNHHCTSNNFFNQNKIFNSKISIGSTKNQTTPCVSSNFVQPAGNPRLINCSEDPPSTPPFKFDPVILEPKKFSCDSFPQSNSERQMRNSELTKINTCLENSKTESTIINNSFKLVLSQSTQLTTEEQSLVESVFDGVDADSLFDDDF